MTAGILNLRANLDEDFAPRNTFNVKQALQFYAEIKRIEAARVIIFCSQDDAQWQTLRRALETLRLTGPRISLSWLASVIVCAHAFSQICKCNPHHVCHRFVVLTLSLCPQFMSGETWSCLAGSGRTIKKT